MTSTGTRIDLADLPPGLAARPVDPKRGVPVPLMNMRPEDLDDFDGEPTVADFTCIWGPTVMRCAQERRCGICGNDLGYWMAFVGGPECVASRAYVDPPFCLDCAEWSLRLCPHLMLQRHRRAPEHRSSAAGVTQHPGFQEAHTTQVCLGVTRDYKIEQHRGSIIFRPAPFKRVERYGYDAQGTLARIEG